jgi:hypothetical protein
MLGRRTLTLILMVAAIALFSAGVAAAAGGWEPGSDQVVSPESIVSPETEGTGDSEVTTTETTATVEADEPEDSESTDSTESTDTTAVEKEHPDNWGGYISGLRHQGDHTPAAVLKGKDVPGYTKKTTTTATVTTPTEPDLSPETTMVTPPTS